MLTDERDNPILYIEELARWPLRRSRPAVPGTIIVYQHRNGRLSAPTGGYTPGEAWWLGALVAHEVDLVPHEFEFSCDLSGLSGAERSYVEGTARWRVVDPIAVVTHRVTDAPLLCRRRLAEVTGQAVAGASGWPQRRLVKALGQALGNALALPEGLRVERARLRTAGEAEAA